MSPLPPSRKAQRHFPENIAATIKSEEARERSRARRIEESRQRLDAASRELWCSWGNHHTFKHRYLKERFSHGSMCMKCQLDMVSNVEAAVELPAVSEAIARQGRTRHLEKKQDAIMATIRVSADPDADGWVYYMRINGHIKIGYTANLRQRSRNYPPGTELLAVEPGTRDLEKRRHGQFSRSLAQGREWFAESPDLEQHIKALAVEYVTPTALMHSYTKHEGIKHV